MSDARIDKQAVRQALREVMDPEVGVNILDLGLIYQVLVGDKGLVKVEMTMTTPACPLGSLITDNVRESLQHVPGVDDVEVTLVWDPPWSPGMMTEEARRQLGWS